MTARNPATGGRGRPPFQPTAARKKRCEEMVAVGMTQQGIAGVFGISIPTLQKHFADQLENGASRRHAEITGMLFKAARGGNVSAQKKLHEIATATMAEKAFTAPAPAEAPVERSPKVGKKEQAALDAKTAGVGSEWGEDLAGPSILN